MLSRDVSKTSLQSELLKVLANPNTDKRLGGGRYYLLDALRSKMPPSEEPSSYDLMKAVWALVAQGLAYIDFSQSAPSNWELFLTEDGQAAVEDEAMNPDNSGDYLQRFSAKTPSASPIVVQYAMEAVLSYTSRCYLASTVMLGVASEAAFLEMASSFACWLPSDKGQKFSQIMENPRMNYINKFLEFRKRIEPLKPTLPNNLADNMSLWLDAVLDLLRIYRNEAGHPTGKELTRDDAFINLRIFPIYVKKLYGLKEFFDSKARN